MSFVGVCQIFVCPSFPLGIEGGMLDVIVLIPDFCLSIYFLLLFKNMTVFSSEEEQSAALLFFGMADRSSI